MDGYSLTAKLRKQRRRFRLTATEQALYHELVAICNEDGWEDIFSVSNDELCSVLNISENTLNLARQSLISANLLYYQSGKSKRQAGRYSFVKPFKKLRTTSDFEVDAATDTATHAEVDTATHAEVDTATKAEDYIKTKTETKTPPVSPKGEESDDVLFDVFWELYDKQVGDSDTIRRKWEKLPPAERLAILEYIPRYKNACPNKRYRKNPATFLDNKSWNDEIIDRSEASPNGLSPKKWTDETDTTTASRLHPALQ